MRRVKSYFRSTIGDERLSNLSLMHIHRHVQIDLDMIIDAFVSRRNQRLDFHKHSINTCIWNIYLSFDTIFQSLWFLSWFPWLMVLLTRKLLNQGFLMVKLKSSLRKFYGRHHDLIDRYGISVSQMTTDMFHLS